MAFFKRSQKQKSSSDSSGGLNEFFVEHHQDYKVTDNGKTIEKRKISDYASAFGNISIPSKSNNIYVWKFKLLKEDTSLHIGITDVSSSDINSSFYENNTSYCAKHAGQIIVEGKNKYNQSWCLKTGSVVTMTLNLKTKQLTFDADTDNQHLVLNDIKYGPSINYRMAVELYNKCTISIISCTSDSIDNADEQKQSNYTQNEMQDGMKALQAENKRLLEENAKLKQEIQENNDILQSTISNAAQNSQQLVKENTMMKQEIDVLKASVATAQKETETAAETIKLLKEQVATLQDDKKENEMMIAEMRKENESLKKRMINTNHYQDWTYKEIILWIVSMDGGAFAKYEEILNKELCAAELTGMDLGSIDKNDLKGFGITVFKDRNILYQKIQQLINNGNKKQNYNHDDNVLDEGAPTAYI